MDDTFDLGIEVPEGWPYTKRVLGAWQIKQNVNIPVIAADGIATGEIARGYSGKRLCRFCSRWPCQNEPIQTGITRLPMAKNQ